ncbi:hypothetical protein [Cellulomonas palmilytica]|uniref:hypothetical protein n=1 Tax=Cellulomonas palmilytica TaxID=2608402 RepID=UPI001F24707C|nr:hypothetical protein [Cellulomonas palmilytica]UJP39758.1 hypothetical protein F1D97_15920 [Cellulomonas palmilytica]
MTQARTRTRLAVALATLPALAVGSLLVAAPASAATGSIVGKVVLPSGVEAPYKLAVAWAPGAKGADFAETTEVDEAGDFKFDELVAGKSYQVSIIDFQGKVATGYYAGSSKYVATSAEATAVKTGSKITVRPVKAAGPTTVRVIAPYLSEPPSWWYDHSGPYLVEPGTARFSGYAGSYGEMPTAASSAFGVTKPGSASFDRPAESGSTVQMSLPTGGLFPGASYTLSFPHYDEEGSNDQFLNAYYYGGTKRVVTKNLAAAGTFKAGASTADIYVFGAKATTAVGITGTAKVGATLKVKAATWSLAGTTSYQWLRDGKEISGATASSYKLTAADLRTKISVKATHRPTIAGNAYGFSTSTKTAAVMAGNAPVAKALPAITGTTKVGKTLTASRGTWDSSGLTFTYQWLRNGTAISGATKNTYVLTSSDAGKKLSVKVTAKRDGYLAGTATSKQTAAISR